MRRFSDAEGAGWEVTIGRESWGTFVLLFSPRDGGGARKSVLQAESHVAAEQELQGLGDEELRRRLEGSEPWG